MQYDTVEEWESAMTTLKAQGHKLVERGIRVAEVWEIDFKADPEGAVKAVVG